jgi:Glycosyltransferase family 87
LIGAWLALRSGKAIWGGVLLGCVIALKLIAWPIVIFLVLRRNWRAVGAAGAVVVVANLAAALVMGFDRVIYYYVQVGASVSALYRASEGNFSILTLGWRIFSGTGSPIFISLEAPPLVAAPAIAPYVSYSIVLILLVAGLVLAARAQSFDTSFGILICVSILISPVAWSHYLVLAIIPIMIAGRYLSMLDLPRWETCAAVVLGLLLAIPRTDLGSFVSLFAVGKTARGDILVPFAAGLMMLIPAVAVLGLLWFVWHQGELCERRLGR